VSKREGVLDRYYPDWCDVLSYCPDPNEFVNVEQVQAMGVREVAFILGRDAREQMFLNLTSVIAEKHQAVDVAWLLEVRRLCEAMGPQLFSDTVRVAGPEDDGVDCRDLVASGELLLFVRLRSKNGNAMSVAAVVPTTHLTPAEDVA